MSCKRYKRIFDYIDMVKTGKVNVCQDQLDMIDNVVLPVLNREDVFVDEEQIEKGLSLQKYFPYKLIEWEIFLFALIAGVYIEDGETREIFFNEIDIYLGRGSGKNGFISFLCFYFLSPYHGVLHYNIDILANSEDQAKTSFDDLFEIIREPEDKYAKAISQNYYATKTIIKGLKTKSTLKYNSSSKRGKDSKRSGCVIFDERHEYEDSKITDTLTSGLGKTPNARVITLTTDGNIRGADLDHMKEKDHDILKQYDPENRTLPFYCHIEAEEEWNNPDAWEKAIPSINHPSFKSLKKRIISEVKNMRYTPEYYATFLTKRMNFPIGDAEIEVASWEDITACNKEFSKDDLLYIPCVGAVDFAKTNDFVAVGLLFKYQGKYYLLHHTFVCKKSSDLRAIKAPIDQWAKDGYVTFVDDVEIPAEMVAGWFEDRLAEGFCIEKIAIDNFRFSILNYAFKKIGFDAYERKNIKLVRPSDIMKAAPLINSVFLNHSLLWGIAPIMCWYTNNTKVIHSNGNMTYGKINEKLRKTDGFMMLAAAFTIVDELEDVYSAAGNDFDIMVL